jgi:hypothetical protein
VHSSASRGPADGVAGDDPANNYLIFGGFDSRARNRGVMDEWTRGVRGSGLATTIAASAHSNDSDGSRAVHSPMTLRLRSLPCRNLQAPGGSRGTEGRAHATRRDTPRDVVAKNSIHGYCPPSLTHRDRPRPGALRPAETEHMPRGSQHECPARPSCLKGMAPAPRSIMMPVALS